MCAFKKQVLFCYIYASHKRLQCAILRFFWGDSKVQYTTQNKTQLIQNTSTITESFLKRDTQNTHKKQGGEEKRTTSKELRVVTCVAKGIPMASKYLRHGHGHFHQEYAQSESQ